MIEKYLEEERQRYEELVAKSNLRLLELRDCSLSYLRSCFIHYMDNYSDDKALEVFDNNDNRKLKLRTKYVEELIYYFGIYNDKELLTNTTKKCNWFCPLSKEEAKTGLSDLNFSNHSLGIDCDWGRGRFEKIKRDIFNAYIVNDGVGGLSYYFYGNIGAGKTTLLTAIARMLYICLNIKPRYITMTNLINLFSASRGFDNKDAQNELSNIENSYFLFIDNLGFPHYTDKQGEWALDFMFDRYRKNKPVFLATNKDIRCDELQKIAFNQQLNSWLKDSNYFHIPICFDWNDRRS